jgi:hypothetical protein
MKEKIAIKMFRVMSFDVPVQKTGGSKGDVRIVSPMQPELAHGSTEGRMSSEGIATEAAFASEPTLADTLGWLSGDGMWVGDGGVSFLPLGPAKHPGVNQFCG